MSPPTLRMRLYPKPEGDEAPRRKGEREPFPKLRLGQMSSKYILSWAACSCPHVHICEKGGEGKSMLLEKHLRAESQAKTRKVLCLPKGTNPDRG